MINNELLSFSDDEIYMPSLCQNEKSKNWNLLVVDDDKAVHEITQLVLRKITVLNRPIEIHSAYSAIQAKKMLNSDTLFAFALIDVVMETDDAGLTLVKWIRETKNDANIRLVLRTGQPGEAPEKDIISDYDIHDYKEKNELTAKKLFTLCHSCLRTYNDIVKAKKLQEIVKYNARMNAIGQLALGIVHDFNNISGVILGNAELLQQMPFDNEKQQEKVSSINKAALMGKNIVNKLHYFTSNKLERAESININDIIKKMASVIEQSTSNNFQVDYQLENSLWLTNIVINDFESALFNLIINANDALSNNGNISIQTKNCLLDDKFCLANTKVNPGEYVSISVSDNGSGISPEAMQHIFEPFYSTKSAGTGLGLALIFGFVSRSSGCITVKSEASIGTRFKLYLPRIINNR